MDDLEGKGKGVGVEVVEVECSEAGGWGLWRFAVDVISDSLHFR